MRVLRRFWPIALLLAAIAAAWVGGLTQQVSWAALARNQALLAAWVASHPITAPSLYMLIYAAAVLILLPESAVLTVAGGLLFGSLSGGILAIVGSSAGAIALFLAVRHHLADAVRRPPRPVRRRRPPQPAARRIQLSARHPSGAGISRSGW